MLGRVFRRDAGRRALERHLYAWIGETIERVKPPTWPAAAVRTSA